MTARGILTGREANNGKETRNADELHSPNEVCTCASVSKVICGQRRAAEYEPDIYIYREVNRHAHDGQWKSKDKQRLGHNGGRLMQRGNPGDHVELFAYCEH